MFKVPTICRKYIMIAKRHFYELSLERNAENNGQQSQEIIQLDHTLLDGASRVILLSKRPSRTNASSSASGSFVAANTTTPSWELKPSISANSWFIVALFPLNPEIVFYHLDLRTCALNSLTLIVFQH